MPQFTLGFFPWCSSCLKHPFQSFSWQSGGQWSCFQHRNTTHLFPRSTSSLFIPLFIHWVILFFDLYWALNACQPLWGTLRIQTWNTAPHLSSGSMKFNGRDNRKLYNYVVRVIIAVFIMQEYWGCLEGLLGKAGLEWSPKGWGGTCWRKILWSMMESAHVTHLLSLCSL